MNTPVNYILTPLGPYPELYHLHKDEKESEKNHFFSNSSNGGFTEVLNNLKIIDVNGRFTADFTDKKLPDLLPEQANKIYELLNDKFEVAFDEQINNKTCHHKSDIPIKELINFLIAGQHKDNYRIYIRGGYLRKLLLNHYYFCKTLEMLGVQNPEKILSDDIFEESKRKIPDVDFVIKIPKCENADLYSYGAKMIGYLNNIFFESAFEGVQRIKENAFTKFNVEAKEGNEFAIITLKGESGLQLEFLIERQLKRKKLFSVDDFQLEVTSLLKIEATNTQPLQVLSSGNGLQSLIDLGTKIIDIDDPEKVNEYGFSMLLSYYCRGYVLGTPDGLSYLINKSIKLQKYESIRSNQLITQISKVIDEHHHHNPLTAIPMIFHSCLKLQETFSTFEMSNLTIKMAEAYSPRISEKTQKGSLLDLISDAIFNKKIPVHIVKACLELGAFYRLGTENTDYENSKIVIKPKVNEGEPSIQIRLKEDESILYFLLPFSLPESLELIKSYFQTNNQSTENLNCLTAIIEKIMDGTKTFKENGLVPLLNFRKPFIIEEEKLFGLSKELLSSKTRPLRFFGYVLHLALGSTFPKKIYIQDLLFHYIDMTDFTKILTFRDQIQCIMRQTAYSPLCPPEHNPMQKYHETSIALNIKEKLIKWTCSLANTQDRSLCEVSYQLWVTHSSKYPAEEQKKFGMELLLMLLPYGVNYSIQILSSIQTNKLSYEQETTALSKIISSLKVLENMPLAEENSQVIYPLIKNLFRNHPASNHPSSPFLKQLNWFLQNKLALQDSEKAHHLLLQASKIKPFSNDSPKNSHSWLVTLESSLNNQNFTNAYTIWNDGESHGVWERIIRDQRYHFCLVSLAENLLKISSTTVKGIKILDLLSTIEFNNDEINKRFKSCATNVIYSLLESPDIKEGLTRLNKKYRRYFTVIEIVSIKLNSIELNFNKKNFINGFKIWKNSIEAPVLEGKREALKLQTINILTILINKEYSLENIHLVSRILTNNSLETWITNAEVLRAEFYTKSLEFLINKGKAEKLSAVFFLLEKTLDYVFTKNQTQNLEITRSAATNLRVTLKNFGSSQTPPPKTLKQKIIESYPALLKFHQKENLINEGFEMIEEMENAQIIIPYNEETGSLSIQIIETFLNNSSLNLSLLNKKNSQLIILLNKIHFAAIASQKSVFSTSKLMTEAYLKSKNGKKAFAWMKAVLNRDIDELSISSVTEWTMQLINIDITLGTEILLLLTSICSTSQNQTTGVLSLWLVILNKADLSNDQKLQEYTCSVFHKKIVNNEMFTGHSECLTDCWIVWLKLLRKFRNNIQSELLSEAITNNSTFMKTFNDQTNSNKMITASNHLFLGNLEMLKSASKKNPIVDKIIKFYHLLKNKLPKDFESYSFINTLQLHLINCMVETDAPFYIGPALKMMYSSIIERNYDNDNLKLLSNTICKIGSIIKKIGTEANVESFAKILAHPDALRILQTDQYSYTSWCVIKRMIVTIGKSNRTFDQYTNNINILFKNFELIMDHEESVSEWIDFTLDHIISALLINSNESDFKKLIFQFFPIVMNKVKFCSISVNENTSLYDLLRNEKKIDPNNHALIEQLFYRSMYLLTTKLMETRIQCIDLQKFISDFVSRNIYELVSVVPGKINDTIKLFDKYIFWFNLHVTVNSREQFEPTFLIYNKLNEVNAYKNSNALQFKHQLLLAKEIKCSALTKENKAEIIVSLLEKLIPLNNDTALFTASCIIDRYQNDHPINSNKLIQIYQLLFDRLETFYQVTFDGITLYECIGHALSHIKLSPRSNSLDRKKIGALYNTFFGKMYIIYTNFDSSKISKQFQRTKIQILYWLIRFIMSTRHPYPYTIGVNTKNESLFLVELLTQQATKHLPDTEGNIKLKLPIHVIHLILGCPLNEDGHVVLNPSHLKKLPKEIKGFLLTLIHPYIQALIDQNKECYLPFINDIFEILLTSELMSEPLLKSLFSILDLKNRLTDLSKDT